MKILIFLPMLTEGGAEHQGFLLARYLKDRGYAVEVWGFANRRGLGSLIPKLKRWGLEYQEIRWQLRGRRLFTRPATNLMSWIGHALMKIQYYSLPKHLAKRKFDVVIPFTFWPSLIASAYYSKWSAGICVWNHRGGYDDGKISYNRAFVRGVLRHRPIFVANSLIGARFLRDKFNLKPDEVFVIRNCFIPEGALIQNKSTRFPLDLDLSLVHVANFFPQKDYETILEALRLLKERQIPFRMHFFGGFLSAEDEQQFLARVRHLQLSSHVSYHGARSHDEILEFLNSADVGLLSSSNEGQPNALMEYMYAGLPIIATRIPGIQEVAGSINEPWLFDPRDSVGLAVRIESLFANPELRASLGRQNRDRILRHFGPDQTLRQWEQLVLSRLTNHA
ncbi:MAG: glycosyltransferase family 4 protein [Verrucomicrobiae bacterium]|nr:glycosyltransferase family 4 protein [Verrucomicrobiae bacterium]